MKLIIPARFERRLKAYVKSVQGEIAGMGEVEMRDDGNLWVTDLAIYDQEVTGGTADLSQEALASFMTELVKSGRSPKNWYLWWHSHSNMGAFFSTIDTGTIDRSTEFDHILSLVVNKKGERKCRLDTHHPFRITLDNIPVEIQAETNPRTQEIDDEIFEMLKRAEELEKQRSEIEEQDVEDVTEEVKAKVREKSWPKPWAHTPARAPQGNKSFLKDDFDEDWSKKRKKSGSVITNRGDIEVHALDKDELELLIEQTASLIRAHVANGNGGEAECEELRADLAAYYSQYVDVMAEEYGGDFPGENEMTDKSGYYLDGVFVPYDFDYNDDTPIAPLALPGVTSPYQAGFHNNKDDERN